MRAVRATAAFAAALALGATAAHAATTRTVADSVASSTAPVLYLSGAVRCTSGVYSVIGDASHSPFGIASVTTTSTYVRVTFDVTLTAVGDMQITPDETYVQNGVSMGGSVGLSYVDIKFALDGNAVAPASVCYAYSNVWLNGHGYL